MNMVEIREVAKRFDIKIAKMKKADLVQSIQLAEGNFNCFASAVDGICDQTECIWREDCFALAKKKAN